MVIVSQQFKRGMRSRNPIRGSGSAAPSWLAASGVLNGTSTLILSYGLRNLLATIASLPTAENRVNKGKPADFPHEPVVFRRAGWLIWESLGEPLRRW